MDRRLMAEARLAQAAFIGSVTFSLLDGVLILGQAWVLSHIINAAFLEGAAFADLRGLFLRLAILIALRAANRSLIQISSSEVSIRVKEDLRARVDGHLAALGPAYTAYERSGELAAAMTSGMDALDKFFRDYMPAIFTSLLVPLVILGVVLPIDTLTFVVLLVTFPLIPVFMSLIGMVAGALSRKQYAQLGGMSAHFLDVMQGLTTLKLFNRSRPQVAIIETITDRFRESTMGVLRVAFLSAFALEFLATISVAVVAVEIGFRLLAGNMPFLDALFLLVIAPEFYMPMRNLGAKYHAGQDGAAAADRIYAILNTAPPAPGGSKVIDRVQGIHFEAVSFAYGDGDRPALEGISFEAGCGEHIAFVGATGSGKSTVAALLLGFITPDAGRILIDTGDEVVDLKELDTNIYRERLAWVPQRGYLFNMSAAQNIRISAPGADEARLHEAAKLAEAHAFITALPAGYDTVLGENATRLSGGQAQRIALARALIRDADLLIFDEATANLDTATEEQIMRKLAAQPFDGIRITIAHHLSTVTDADRIYVLDGGRIVEQGTHRDLIAGQGAYFGLLQASGERAHG